MTIFEITTVEVCARQGISLRENRDDAKYLAHSGINSGIFQALFEFHCDPGDTILSKHLKECSKNSSYRTKTTQNDIINVIGGMITEKIVTEVKEVKYFTIIYDEVQNVAANEQTPL